MKSVRKHAVLLAALVAAMGQPLQGAKAAAPAANYLADKFSLERVLDWGDRPVWSPDGTRIAFTESDARNGPAYELDLRTRKVRCLTCRWGAGGRVTRIYYLPDGNFLLLANPGLETAATTPGESKGSQLVNQMLYWMPTSAAMPPQALNVTAGGEIALDYQPLPDGGLRIAWGVFGDKPYMMTGDIVTDGARAALTNRKTVYAYPPADKDSLVTAGETYDFAQDGKSLLFFTVEKGKAANGMYMLDLESGDQRRMPTDGAHNETHLFPDERYGLEESNRASDPSSPIRGITGHSVKWVERMLKGAGQSDADADALAQRYGGRGFDLFVHEWPTGKRRRLTFVSDIGGEAHQSSPSRDGKHVVFAMRAPKSGPYAGKGGLYVGTFGAADTAK